MTLLDNRNPRIIVLRRKGRAFADAGGACRAVIECELRARGIATGRVRTGCRGSGGVSGGASTDHPSGSQAITLRSMTRIGGHRRRYSAGFSRPMTMTQVNPEDDENEPGVKG
jgi:hypothetical protein